MTIYANCVRAGNVMAGLSYLMASLLKDFSHAKDLSTALLICL
jgi:hypothetical protein